MSLGVSPVTCGFATAPMSAARRAANDGTPERPIMGQASRRLGTVPVCETPPSTDASYWGVRVKSTSMFLPAVTLTC